MNQDTQPEAKLAKRSMISLYREVVQNYDFIPADKILSIFTGQVSTNFWNVRAKLTEEGYKFEKYNLDAYAGPLWKVVERPKTEEEVRQDLIQEIDKNLANWSVADVKTLLDIVEKNKAKEELSDN